MISTVVYSPGVFRFDRYKSMSMWHILISYLNGFVLQITRFGPNVAQYYMLTHKKEPPSTTRFANLESGARRYDTDGLSNLEYRVLNHQLRPLYSWILADV